MKGLQVTLLGNNVGKIVFAFAFVVELVEFTSCLPAGTDVLNANTRSLISPVDGLENLKLMLGNGCG